jgi:hypothetical protein
MNYNAPALPPVTFDGAVVSPEQQRIVTDEAAKANLRALYERFPNLKRLTN